MPIAIGVEGPRRSGRGRALRRGAVLLLLAAGCRPGVGPDSDLRESELREGDLRELDGTWTGATDTTQLRLHIRFVPGCDDFGCMRNTHSLEYSGYLIDHSADVADTVPVQRYWFPSTVPDGLRPAHFSLLSIATSEERRAFSARAQLVAEDRAEGWLFREYQLRDAPGTLDSAALTLHRR